MNSCGASPREEQDNRLCVGCYYILDHSLSGLFLYYKGVIEEKYLTVVVYKFPS